MCPPTPGELSPTLATYSTWVQFNTCSCLQRYETYRTKNILVDIGPLRISLLCHVRIGAHHKDFSSPLPRWDSSRRMLDPTASDLVQYAPHFATYFAMAFSHISISLKTSRSCTQFSLCVCALHTRSRVLIVGNAFEIPTLCDLGHESSLRIVSRASLSPENNQRHRIIIEFGRCLAWQLHESFTDSVLVQLLAL